jgi:hypothetical protein
MKREAVAQYQLNAVNTSASALMAAKASIAG